MLTLFHFLSFPIIHLSSSFFIMNCGICANRKWNYPLVSLLPFIFASCSQTLVKVRYTLFLFEIITLFIYFPLLFNSIYFFTFIQFQYDFFLYSILLYFLKFIFVFLYLITFYFSLDKFICFGMIQFISFIFILYIFFISYVMVSLFVINFLLLYFFYLIFVRSFVMLCITETSVGFPKL